MIVGFFVFGLLALIGSYLWYRATVDAVPKSTSACTWRSCCSRPSIAFWPSSIGKESLMQLGIGTVALGTAYLLRQRLLGGLAIGAAGGWLLWVVRPHLLALVTRRGRVRLLRRTGAGRPRATTAASGGPWACWRWPSSSPSRSARAPSSSGIEDLSLSSIEAELDEQTERSAQGGSEFDNGGNSLNPVNLPRGAATVLLRPFPWETESRLQLLSSLESVMLAAFIVAAVLLPAGRPGRRPGHAVPPLLLGAHDPLRGHLSSFANFGLLVRQRSLVLPALFVLLAVEPARRRHESARLSDPHSAGAVRS